MPDAILTIMLAREFGELMGEWLTPRELAVVRKKNATPAYATACASHDFCDANMCMLDAFTGLMSREPAFSDDEPQQEVDLGLINGAWALAKRLYLTEAK
jgi:hypothetical protein